MSQPIQSVNQPLVWAKRCTDPFFRLSLRYDFLRLTLATCFAGLPMVCHVFAQSARSDFRLSVNVETVEIGTHFEAVFELENERAQEFVPPVLHNLRIVSGPVTGIRTTIINGAVNNMMTWTYYYEPITTGKATIGLATAVTLKRKYHTQPVEITVTPERPAQRNSTDQDVFIEAVVSHKNAFVGQQITVDYILYTASNLSNIIVLRDAEWSNADFEELSVAQGTTTKKKIGSKLYVSRLIKRVAVFPKSAGKTTGSPLTIQVSAEKGHDPFFMSPRLEDLRISSPAVSIDVQAPQARDSLFTGIVGQLNGRCDLASPTTVSIQDLITLRIELESDAYGSYIWIPHNAFDTTCKVVDIQVIKKDKFERQGRLWESRLFEITLQPLHAGTVVLQPRLNYLSQDSGYEELRLSPYTIQIINKGQSIDAHTAQQNTVVVQPAEPFNEQGATQKRKGILHKGWFWLLVSFPWLAALGLAATKRIGKRIQDAQPQKPQWETLYTQCVAALQSQPVSTDTESARQTYRRILKEINRYAYLLGGGTSADQYAPVGDIAKSLEESGFPQNTVERYVALARLCERIVYAGQAPVAPAQDSQSAIELLKQLRLDRKSLSEQRASV